MNIIVTLFKQLSWVKSGVVEVLDWKIPLHELVSLFIIRVLSVKALLYVLEFWDCVFICLRFLSLCLWEVLFMFVSIVRKQLWGLIESIMISFFWL